MSLRILATGGTFDKHYDPIAGQLGFAGTHLPAIVERARVAGNVAVEVAMLVDSLDMTDAHREAVLAACRAAPETAIVVVHGTDTMVETARVLGAARLPKTIVLTGAMVPYELEGSDAMFNLGFAMACARTLGEGVWIAMNAAAHRWDAVRKNRELGRFESLPGDA
jgi:L-asparaginase